MPDERPTLRDRLGVEPILLVPDPDAECVCPNCGHPIPRKCLEAMEEKIALGQRAECDFCPY